MNEIVPSVEELRCHTWSLYYRELVAAFMNGLRTRVSFATFCNIPMKYRKKECQDNEDNRSFIQMMREKGYTVEQLYNKDDECDDDGWVYRPATEEQTQIIRVIWGFVRSERKWTVSWSMDEEARAMGIAFERE